MDADEKKDKQMHIFRITVGRNQILKGGKNPEILYKHQSSLCGGRGVSQELWSVDIGSEFHHFSFSHKILFVLKLISSFLLH